MSKTKKKVTPISSKNVISPKFSLQEFPRFSSYNHVHVTGGYVSIGEIAFGNIIDMDLQRGDDFCL